MGVEELDAFVSAGKRVELETRASQSLMRDEEGEGAPAFVDFESGTVRLPRAER